jgi:hydroxymethylpyrimidine/phosphomethylpyrimidine kinase
VRGQAVAASALAANLANGKAPCDAARDAKTWLTEQFRGARIVGGGRRIAAP